MRERKMTSILLIDDPCGVPLDLWTDPLEDVTRGSMSPDGARPAPPAAASMSVLRARLRCDRERGAPGTGCTLYCARAASNAAASSACEGGRDWNWIRETFFLSSSHETNRECQWTVMRRSQNQPRIGRGSPPARGISDVCFAPPLKFCAKNQAPRAKSRRARLFLL